MGCCELNTRALGMYDCTGVDVVFKASFASASRWENRFPLLSATEGVISRDLASLNEDLVLDGTLFILESLYSKQSVEERHELLNRYSILRHEEPTIYIPKIRLCFAPVG